MDQNTNQNPTPIASSQPAGMPPLQQTAASPELSSQVQSQPQPSPKPFSSAESSSVPPLSSGGSIDGLAASVSEQLKKFDPSALNYRTMPRGYVPPKTPPVLKVQPEPVSPPPFQQSSVAAATPSQPGVSPIIPRPSAQTQVIQPSAAVATAPSAFSPQPGFAASASSSASSAPVAPPPPPPPVSASRPEPLSNFAPTPPQSTFQSKPKQSKALTAVAVIIALIAFGTMGYFGYQYYQKSQIPPVPTIKVIQQPAPAAAVSQIPDSWRIKYFGAAACSNQDVCGDAADPDHDGLTNLEEYKLNTDPNNADSSGSGIADGDKVHVFNLDPLSNHTAGVATYTDAGDLKFKYNSKQHRPFTDAELVQIAANIKQYGLHSPTIKTLSQDILIFYTNYVSTQPVVPAPTSSTGTTGATAQDRDAQRINAINQISFALLKYQTANKNFPDTNDFSTMIADIKPLLSGVAVNTTDPVNKAPYVYGYASVNKGRDFQLTYYAEVEKQQIVINSAAAQKALSLEQSQKRDAQRIADIQQIDSALQLYSSDNANPNQPDQKVFPAAATWTQALVPKYLATMPLDPQSNKNYSYTVPADTQTFTLQATLENLRNGKSTYTCTQDACDP